MIIQYLDVVYFCSSYSDFYIFPEVIEALLALTNGFMNVSAIPFAMECKDVIFLCLIP